MSEKKKSDEIEIPVKWLTIGLVIIVIVALIFILPRVGINLGIGNTVSQSQAEQNLLDFFEREIPTSQLEVIESSDQGDFYEFMVSIDGETVPLYVTKDGNYMTIDLIPIT